MLLRCNNDINRVRATGSSIAGAADAATDWVVTRSFYRTINPFSAATAAANRGGSKKVVFIILSRTTPPAVSVTTYHFRSARLSRIVSLFSRTVLTGGGMGFFLPALGGRKNGRKSVHRPDSAVTVGGWTIDRPSLPRPPQSSVSPASAREIFNEQP